MMLPLSTASPSASSASFASTLPNVDPTHAFRHFLDLITPAELSKLLRTRVRHLLSIWPPQSESTLHSSGSSSLSRPERSASPSLESIEAFTSFFRSQDSPPPSPSDISPATPLFALHHRLLALQTLLSFLSARELKDVVRARLSEASKDRSTAVQGLMDIIRNPRERRVEDLFQRYSQPLPVRKENIPRDREGGTADTVTTAAAISHVSPSVLLASRQKKTAQSFIDTEDSIVNNAQPSQRRQMVNPIHTSERPTTVNENIAFQSTPLSSSNSRPSVFPHCEPTSLHLQGMQTPEPSSINSPCSRVLHPSLRLRMSHSEHEHKKLSEEQPPSIINAEFKLEEGSQIQMNYPSYSAIPPEGDDAASSSAPGLQRVSVLRPDLGPQKRPRYVEKVENAELDLFIRNEEQTPCSDSAMPLKESQGDSCDQQSRKPLDVKQCSTDSEPAIAGTDDNVMDIGTSSRLRTPLLSPESPISNSSASLMRSRSCSLHRSMSDRASPPGPMLRTAVDWASGVSSSADRGSEDSSVFAPGTIYKTERDDDTFTPGMFAPKSFMEGRRGGWDGDDETRISEVETDDSSGERRRKILIRLPARPRTKSGDSGVAANESIPMSGSPTLEHGVKWSPQSDNSRDTRPAGVSSSGKNDPQRSNSTLEISKSASTSRHTPNPTPSTGTILNIAAPHAQYPMHHHPDSRPHTGSPGLLPHSPYALPPTTYPAHPPPYPGPWFGAMFYVPFRGHPHPPTTMHHMPKLHVGSSRHPSDVTASKSTKTTDKSEGHSEASAAQASTSAHPPVTRKKVQKRRVRNPDPVEQPPSPVPDPHVTYTDDIGVKESATVKRQCHNCRSIQAPSWRRSKLAFGKILCNKCGIYESTHMTARPLKTRPRRSEGPRDRESTPPKKRRPPKKPPAAP